MHDGGNGFDSGFMLRIALAAFAALTGFVLLVAGVCRALGIG